jgi:MIP family channel proteins
MMAKEKLSQSLTAEFVGTFALVFLGAGAGALGTGGLVGVAFAHGFAVLAFAYAFGHLSGTHVNPAVTLALLAIGKIDARRAFSYIVFQFVGAIVGGYALAAVLGSSAGTLGRLALAPDVSAGRGFALEAILAFFLVTVVCNAAVSGKAGNLAGVAIGATLVINILMGGPLTGAGFNPARALGPAMATGNFTDLWLYLVAPVVGGIAASVLYRQVLEPQRG